MERLAGANGVFLTTRLIRRLVSTGALIGFAFFDLYGVGEGQVHSPRVQEEAARLGVLSADVAEMIDDYQSLGTPSRQAVIDSTFDAIERTSANAGISQRFVALRPQLVSIKDRADQQSVFSAYTSATHAYVATLPTAIGRCFVIGTGLRQVYYNATGSRNVEAECASARC